MKVQFTRVAGISILLLITLCFIIQEESTAQNIENTGKLRIATSQFPVSADIDSNAVWIKRHMKEAKKKDAQIIHFPECALSGYAGVDHKSLDNFNWSKLHSQTKSIISLADELDLWVLLAVHIS